MNLEILDTIRKRASEHPGELLNPDGLHFNRWVMNGPGFLVGEVEAARDDVLTLCAEVERLHSLLLSWRDVNTDPPGNYEERACLSPYLR